MIIHDTNCKHAFSEKASMLNDVTRNIAYMQTIGDVLKQARESLDLSQQEVAARVRKLTGIGFTRSALAQIEAGTTKNPKPYNLQAACDTLKIDFRSALSGRLAWLSNAGDIAATLDSVTGIMHANVDNDLVMVAREIPLLSWTKAGEFCEATAQFTRADAEEMLPSPLCHTGQNTFALTVRGDSMATPEGYQEGEIVYIDPDLTATPGKDVLAKLENGGTTLKRYKEDEDGPYLLQLNGNKIIRPSEPWHICGVVVFSGRRR